MYDVAIWDGEIGEAGSFEELVEALHFVRERSMMYSKILNVRITGPGGWKLEYEKTPVRLGSPIKPNTSI